MGFAVGQDDASWFGDEAEGQGVGGCAGGDVEDGDGAFEDLAEVVLDLLVEGGVAVGLGVVGGVGGEAGGDEGVGAGPVVGGEVHGCGGVVGLGQGVRRGLTGEMLEGWWREGGEGFLELLGELLCWRV